MKRKIVGLFLAATMALSGSVAAFASGEAAGEKFMALTGTIDEASLKIDFTAPSFSALVIRPYAKVQIGTHVDATGGLDIATSQFVNNTTADDTGMNIDVSLVGYTATATSKTSADPIVLKSTKTTLAQYMGTKKEACMSIQMTPGLDPTELGAVTTVAELDAITMAADEMIGKLSTGDYTKGGTVAYTKFTTAKKVTLGPTEASIVRVTGTMNPGANWEAGDKIVVTPVFNVGPSTTPYEVTTEATTATTA